MPEEKVYAIAHLQARSDTRDELKALLTSFLEPIGQESGCIRFELMRIETCQRKSRFFQGWRNAG